MKKIIFFLTFILFLSMSSSVKAVCPVCTVAVATGLGVSRWIGIDDTVMGVWIGGLVISSGLWMADWIQKKRWKLPYPKLSSIFIMTVFVLPSLYWSHMIGLPGNSLWGIDKIICGSSTGMLVFLLGVGIDQVLRRINDGKVYIYFQKVIIPVLLLTLSSFIFYLITK